MRPIPSILITLGCLAAAPLCAQTDQTQEIAELRAQIVLLAERLAQIEQRAAAPIEVEEETEVEQVAIVPNQPVEAAWTDSLRVAGDLRYRHESINDDLSSERHRQRIRARLNVTADLAENASVVFGLSTGGRTNDSGNQTMGDGFSYKPIDVDLAYFNWGVTDSLNLLGGKMPSPFFRPTGYHLVYDSDIRPEGLALRYNSGSFFGNASAFWAEERSQDPDSMLFGLQAGYRGTLNNGFGLTAGASYYETTHMRGRAPLFSPGNGQGNQLDANGNYLYGFSQINLFGELRFELAGEPVTLFADYVRNTDADAFDEGFAFGGTYRSASNPGDWSLAYIYQDSEANSVVGAFTDSDFAGGTSDGSGHTLRAGYVFRGGWNFAVRYVIGDRGEGAGLKRDYNRLMADVSFSY